MFRFAHAALFLKRQSILITRVMRKIGHAFSRSRTTAKRGKNKRKTNPSKFAVILPLVCSYGAGVILLPNSAHAQQTQIINNNGGFCDFNSANGGLRIHTAANSQFQVERCDAVATSDRARQFFNAGELPPEPFLFNSMYLRIGNVVFGADTFSNSNFGANIPGQRLFRQVSSSGGSATGDGTSRAVYAADLNGLTYTITQTVSYVFPNDFYTVDIEIDVPAGNVQEVDFYSWTDLMLDGDDFGQCIPQTTFPRFVGGDNRAGNYFAGYRERDVSQSWDTFFCGFYGDPTGTLGSSANFISEPARILPNTNNTNTSDIGAATHWNVVDTGGTSFRAQFDFIFSVKEATLTKRFGPLDEDNNDTIAPGETTSLTFKLTNVPGNPAVGPIAFTDTLPEGVSIVGTPSASQCRGTVSTGTAGPRQTVSLSNGRLNGGEASCEVTLNVTASAVGEYTNTAANISGLTFAQNQANAALTVEAQSAALLPFTCPAEIIQVYNDAGLIGAVDLVNGGFDNLPNSLGFVANSAGYRAQDNFIYAFSQTDNAAAGVQFGDLLRIGNDGAFENLGGVPDPENTGGVLNPRIAADFGPDGSLHIIESGLDRVHRVDVTTQTVISTYALNDPLGNVRGVADMAYNPVTGLFYAVENATDQLFSFVPEGGGPATGAVGAVTRLGAGIGPTTSTTFTQGFGAIIADRDGRVFGVGNANGAVLEFDIVTGLGTFVGQGSPATSNDGAFCPLSAIALPNEFGDAPVSGTIDGIDASYGEASQGFGASNSLVIGANSTVEGVNQASDTADADVDDGLSTVPVASGTAYSITVPVINDSGSDAFLCGFIDAGASNGFNGGFDAADERVCATVPSNNASQDVDLDFAALDFTAAPGASTFLRLRLSSVQAEAETATGAGASIGEVEDYVVAIAASTPIVPAATDVCVNRNLPFSGRPDLWWDANDTAGIFPVDIQENNIPSLVSNAPNTSPYIIGAGLSAGPNGFTQQISNVDANTLDEARTNEEYVEFFFDTQAGFISYIEGWTTFGANNIPNLAVDIATEANFSDAVNIFDGSPSTAGGGFREVNTAAQVILPETRYYVRVYFYGFATGFIDSFGFNFSSCADNSDSSASIAAHRQFAAQTHHLGSLAPDIDDFLPGNAEAALDDTSGVDDEDGVVLPALTQGQTITVTAGVSGAGGFLQGWIDFDGSGTFEDGEQVATDLTDGGTGDTDSDTGSIAFDVAVPAGAAVGDTFARFRWSTVSGLNATDPAPDGEVEDYQVAVAIDPRSGLTPFTCSADLYQAFGTNGQIGRIDLANGSFENIGSGSGGTLGPVGYRVSDNLVYALRRPPAGGAFDRLVVVDGLGAVVDLGGVTGLSPGSYNTGDIAGDGLLHIRATGTQSGPIIRIDVDTREVVGSYGLSPAIAGSFADMTFDPVTGLIYTVPVGTTRLHSIDPDTGATALVANLNVDGAPFTGNTSFGAMFADASGNFFAMSNGTGNLYRIDTATGNTQLVGTGAASATNDGFSCAAATFSPGDDQSDAPASFGDAVHSIDVDIRLGALNDADPGSLAGADADADGADDDGVTLPTFIRGEGATITAQVNGTGGFLQGWIDFDGSGTFEDSEQVATDLADGGPGDTDSDTGSISFDVAIPAGAALGDTFARFRWSTVSGLNATDAAPDGEVEDYQVTVTVPPVDLEVEVFNQPVGTVIVGVPFSTVLRVENTSAIDTTDVTANWPVPAGLTLIELFNAEANAGSGDFDPTTPAAYDESTGILTVGDLAASSQTHFIARYVRSGPGSSTVQVEISAADQPDTDSTPNNGFANGEDDTSEVSVTAANTIVPGVCQTFDVRTGGFASVNSLGEYIVTPDAQNSPGFLWSNQRLDLAEDFDIELSVFLGTKDGNGADGMTFVIQNDPRGVNAQGVNGGFMGVGGIPGVGTAVAPSLVVEFDTFANGPNWGDTTNLDHTAVYLDGDLGYAIPSNELIGATLVGNGGNIEDGRYYPTRYIWDASAQTLQYYFDGVLIGTINQDLITHLGTQFAIVGFTGSTGLFSNEQKGCFTRPPVLVDGDAQISGVVFIDANENNAFDNGETEISDVTVRAFNAGADGEFGTLDDELIVSGETGSPYNLQVPPGEYQLEVERNDPDIPSGFRPSITSSRIVSVTAGETVQGQDFGFAPEIIAAPANPGVVNVCNAPQNWRELQFNEQGVATVDGLTSTISTSENVVVLSPYNPDTSFFDEEEHTRVNDGLGANPWRYRRSNVPGINDTITQSFDGREVYEVRFHINSLDQIGFEFIASDNPDIGWEILSSNDDGDNIASNPDLFFVDTLERDADPNQTSEQLGGDAGRSADGTIRFYTLTDQPMEQIVWRFREDPIRRGNVEIFQIAEEVCMPLEFSDAPLTGTSYGSAAHGLSLSKLLGTASTADPAPFDSADASEDVGDDGVAFPQMRAGEFTSITVTASGTGGFLQAWIDWNADGDFDDAADQIATDVQDGVGNGTINLPVQIPADATLGNTFARFRWSTQPGLASTGDAPDGEVEDYQIEILPGAIPVSGIVFFDNGAGTEATAHNGLLEGDEAGAGGILVEAVDTATGDVIATALAAGDGTYTLSLPQEQAGRQTLVRVALSGEAALVSNVSPEPVSNVDPSEGVFTFTPAAGDNFTAFNFGIAGAPRLTESQSQTVQAGSTTLLRHRFTAETEMEVSLSLQNESQSVENTFTANLFSDENCDEEIGSGENILAGTIAASAGDIICLIVRVTSDVAAPNGASLNVELEANATYDNLAPSFVAALNPVILSNTDRVIIGNAGSLALTKEVCNLMSGPCDLSTGVGFSVNNSGTPGDILIYRISFEVPGNEPLEGLKIVDKTPAYSSLTATPPSIVSMPESLACALTEPANALEGYEGLLEWTCIGTVAPGSRGAVSFEVQIAR